jgi:hypothetical protein
LYFPLYRTTGEPNCFHLLHPFRPLLSRFSLFSVSSSGNS